MGIARHHWQRRALADVSRGRIFADCTAEQLRRLDSLATVVTVPAGRDLTVQRSRGKEFGIIVEGVAAVVIDGREVARRRAGDHYGEMALLDDPMHSMARRATVTTTGTTKVAAMTVAEFRMVLEDMPAVAQRILQEAFRRALD